MKEPVEWDDKDVDAIKNRTFGNGVLALLPALYSWQVHGWVVGIIVYAVVLFVLARIGWGIVGGRIRPTHAVWYRVLTLAVAFALIGFSAIRT